MVLILNLVEVLEEVIVVEIETIGAEYHALKLLVARCERSSLIYQHVIDMAQISHLGRLINFGVLILIDLDHLLFALKFEYELNEIKDEEQAV